MKKEEEEKGEGTFFFFLKEKKDRSPLRQTRPELFKHRQRGWLPSKPFATNAWIIRLFCMLSVYILDDEGCPLDKTYFVLPVNHP